jgi:hypothetical protein
MADKGITELDTCIDNLDTIVIHFSVGFADGNTIFSNGKVVFVFSDSAFSIQDNKSRDSVKFQY